MGCENWPSPMGKPDCGCPSCRSDDRLIDRLANRSLSAALRHAQDRMEEDFGFEAATPAGKIELPGRFGGWQGGISLQALCNTGQGMLQGPNRFYSQPNQYLLYRIYQERDSRALYIGTALTKSIQNEVCSALGRNLGGRPRPSEPTGRRPSEVLKFRARVSELRRRVPPVSDAQILVQYGRVTLPGILRPHAKILHAYESALKIKEGPWSYVGSVTTFETD